MKRGQGAFEYILLLAGVLLIVVLAIIILRGAVPGTQVNIANCKAQIASVSVCFNTTGGWVGAAQGVTDGCGLDGCLYSETGVSAACESPLEGTPYDDDGIVTPPSTPGTDDDLDRFICGPKP